MDEELVDLEELYYDNKKENRDYMIRVTVCQMILCTLFVVAVFGFGKTSDENRAKLAEGFGFLQSDNLAEEIQAVKNFFDFDAQV